MSCLICNPFVSWLRLHISTKKNVRQGFFVTFFEIFWKFFKIPYKSANHKKQFLQDLLIFIAKTTKTALQIWHFCILQIELDCLKNQNRYSNPLFLFVYIFVVHLCDILCNLTQQNAVATKIFDKQKKKGLPSFFVRYSILRILISLRR